MKIRNLLILAITIALSTVCAPAQERDGARTYTDDSKQAITISRFGTVLNFRKSDGKEIVPDHNYLACPCGDKSHCVGSKAPTNVTTATLEVEFPKQGATLKKGETLIITAMVSGEAMTLKRRLAWMAGSSVVEIVETISESKTAVCSFEESALVPLGKMCPRPPGAAPSLKCPPLPEARQFWSPWQWQLFTRYSLDLSKEPATSAPE